MEEMRSKEWDFQKQEGFNIEIFGPWPHCQQSSIFIKDPHSTNLRMLIEQLKSQIPHYEQGMDILHSGKICCDLNKALLDYGISNQSQMISLSATYEMRLYVKCLFQKPTETLEILAMLGDDVD